MRVNKENKPKIERYIIKQFDTIVKKRGNNMICLIDLWDTQFKVEDKFHITDYMSQKITNEILFRGNHE